MSPAGTSDPSIPDLQLIREWREPIPTWRILVGRRVDRFSRLAVVVFTLVMAVPIPPRPVAPQRFRTVHLVIPSDLLTQIAPNKGKVTRELDVRSAMPAPTPQAPRRPTPPPGPVATPAVPPAPVAPPKIELPQIQVAATPPPGIGNTQQSGTASQALPALPPPVDKPKLAFEQVGGNSGPVTPNPHSKIPLPKTTVDEAARTANQVGGAGVSVGDTKDPLEDLSKLNQAPSPGHVGSNLQLLSDPTGVDFKPYLIQVLAKVRRNWLAVIPQSARNGRRAGC